MKVLRSLFFLSFILAGPLLCGVEPADSRIKGALIDIERYEREFGTATSARATNVNRALKLLSLTRQRLDESPNTGHSSWVEADERYNKLVAHMNELLSPGTASQPAASAPTRPAVETANQSGGKPQMISQYRVRIQKIARDIESSRQTMDQAGPKPFQDPEHVSGLERRAATFQESIDKYVEFNEDPDVIAATGKLAEYRNMITFGKDHAARELAELGDVQARLRVINQEIRQLRLPETPQEPYAAGELNQWLVQLARARQAAARLYEPLPAIKQRAYLPDTVATVEQGGAFDLKDVDRLERALLDLANSIDEGLNTFTRNLDAQVRAFQNTLSQINAYDPADPDDQTNHFLSEGRADEVRAMLNRFWTTVREAAGYARALGHEIVDVRIAQADKVKATIDRYEANYLKARELVRMPNAASTDSGLLKIARETLAGYDTVGDIERMVINADKVKRSEETSEAEFDDIDVSLSGTITLSGTQTTYFYEWEQFQVATAEPVKDTFFIFYNTLKYFTSGASTTPLNRWILSGRIQGSEIPGENIHKD